MLYVCFVVVYSLWRKDLNFAIYISMLKSKNVVTAKHNNLPDKLINAA